MPTRPGAVYDILLALEFHLVKHLYNLIFLNVDTSSPLLYSIFVGISLAVNSLFRLKYCPIVCDWPLLINLFPSDPFFWSKFPLFLNFFKLSWTVETRTFVFQAYVVADHTSWFHQYNVFFWWLLFGGFEAIFYL